RVLQDLRRALPEGAVLSQLILAAPDVDRDNFENIVGSIAGIAEGITLYAAANDQALLVSRQVNGGIPRAGDVPPEGPIVMPGVDTIDATITSMDSLGINHSGYAENNALLEDIKALIGTGTRPPEKRIDLRPADTKLPVLETVTSAKGQYWRYVAKPSP
ncbi:MAG: alpha/beta hydrolase, partial [Hyphomicrobiaceae bacterium]|nr:alpha/beta hydrolase [Hyphomicrobiaceae bacterium]